MRVLISGTCPAALNSNYVLLRHIADGFERLSGTTGIILDVHLVPLEQLLDAIQQWRPSITLLVGGLALDTIPLPIVRHLCDQSGSCLAIWSLEDPYELDYMLRQGHWFDLVVTSDASSRCFYPGDWNVRHLPLASPDHSPPQSGYQLDLSRRWLFCGVPFDCRLQWLDPLVKASPHGLLIGPDWPDYPPPTRVCHQRITPVVLGALYAALPVTLVFGRDLNLANAAGVVPSTPGPRLFECAGVGGRQLVCGPGLELASYYEPGRELLVAQTLEEALEWLAWSEMHPEEIALLGERAWHRTQAEHLYVHRAQQLLRWIKDR
jgi:spore maturation protein CgeB